jgi:hypothetical protein
VEESDRIAAGKREDCYFADIFSLSPYFTIRYILMSGIAIWEVRVQGAGWAGTITFLPNDGQIAENDRARFPVSQVTVIFSISSNTHATVSQPVSYFTHRLSGYF